MQSTFVLFLGLFSIIFAQMCKPTGDWCAETPQCCGGCCIHNFCVQTYEDCRELGNDPCLEYYCPPDSECYIYQPANCPGCEAQTMCRELAEPSSSTAMPLNTTMKSLGTRNKSSTFAIFLHIAVVVYKYF